MAPPKKVRRIRSGARAPEGFLSVAALQRLRRMAIFAGATPLILFFVSYVSMFAFAFLSASLGTKGDAYAVALRNDGAWYIGAGPGKQASLVSLRQHQPPARDKTLVTFTDTLDDVFLLDDPAKQRLWILSDTQQGYWDGMTMRWLTTEKTWAQMSRPFLWDRSPAFLSQAGASVTLLKLEKGAWRQRGEYAFVGISEPASCDCGSVRVARWQNDWYWFNLDGNQLRGFQGQPKGRNADVRNWRTISEDTGQMNWAAKALAGGLYLVDHAQDGAIRVRKRDQGRWVLINKAWGKGEDVALLDGPDAKPMLAVSGPGLTIMSLQGDAPALSVIGPGLSRAMSATIFVSMLLLMLVLFLVFPLMVAFLDRESRLARPARVKFAGQNTRLAGLLRRAGARLIDLLLVLFAAVAVAALCSWPLGLFKDLTDEPAKALFVFMIVGFWALAGQIALIACEGANGRTPGRKVLGIRLLGADLKPCGFMRALLRGLLTLVDGQFFWLPGVLTAALSKHQQRLGDLAAETVVVLEKPGKP